MAYTILCPTDFSEASDGALKYAVELAHSHGGAVVRLLHVDDLPTYGLPDGSVLDGPLRAMWRQRLDELAERFADRVRVEPVLARGRPSTEIVARAAEADLVVMATRRRNAFTRALLGSVAYEVVRGCPVPVITVDPEMSPGPVRGVLVMVDGSTPSEHALDEALRWAERAHATVHLLRAIEVPTHVLPDGESLFEPELLASVRERSAAELNEILARHPTSADVRIHVEPGAPAEVADRLLDEDETIDVVVMGTHGRSGLSRFLLGSVAERMLRTCPVPVMVVREERAPTD
ncbi:MAG: universal stress protein [Sandaracinaceae bacterium]|nr:universal stress protein [Sandaracinaceae bacterium]